MADAAAGGARDDELDHRLRVHRDAIDVLDREILGPPQRASDACEGDRRR